MYTDSGPLGAALRLCMRRPILFVVPLIVGLIVVGAFDGDVEIRSNDPRYEEMYPWACGGIPISFAFDDGYKTVYEEVFPILKGVEKDHNIVIPATAYVITDFVESEDRFMSWDDITELYKHGWEIGSHTKTHPYLTDLNSTALKKELQESKDVLNKKGIDVFTIASPHGDFNDNVIEEIKKSYYGHRTTVEGLNNIPLDDPEKEAYLLKTVFFEGDMTLEEIKQWVDKAFNEGKWLIISFHRVTDSSKVAEDALLYTTDIKEFEELVRYILEKAEGYEIRYTEEMPTGLPTLEP